MIAKLTVLLLLFTTATGSNGSKLSKDGKDKTPNSDSDRLWATDSSFLTLLPGGCDFPTLNATQLPEIDRLMREGTAFKVVGVMDEWPAKKHWQRDHFLAVYGSRTIRAGAESSIVNAGGSPEAPISVATLLQPADPSGNSSRLAPSFVFEPAILSTIPELRDDFAVPSFFSSWDNHETDEREEVWHMLSYGGSRTGLPFHNHGKTWLAVVHGMKQWFVYPLGYGPSAEVDRSVFNPTSTVQQWFNRTWPLLSHLPKPPLSSERKESFSFSRDGYQPLQCLQLAGEVLFLPCQWSHLTLNVGETIGIGGQEGLTDEDRLRNAMIAIETNPDDAIALKDIALSHFNTGRRMIEDLQQEVLSDPKSGLITIKDTDPAVRMRNLMQWTEDSWVVFSYDHHPSELTATADTNNNQHGECVSPDFLTDWFHEITVKLLQEVDINVALIKPNNHEKDTPCLSPVDALTVHVHLHRGRTLAHSGAASSFVMDFDGHWYDGELSDIVPAVSAWMQGEQLAFGSIRTLSSSVHSRFMLAEDYFKRSLLRKPMQPDVLTILSELYVQLKDMEALERLTKITEDKYDAVERSGEYSAMGLASLYHKLSVPLVKVGCFITFSFSLDKLK